MSRVWRLLKQALACRRQFLDLLVGLPHYETYVRHRQLHHPGEPIPTRGEFLRQCQEARYDGKGGKISRCC
ncbi:hypothetical protein J31TS4_04750 [Paenibacillus sp. J31TS4]|uniref:YbdD/YjiX family protein n=1 Tax=Paenibacillus sp. J31TS4 TaxID=2807195 RepID=UPI001B147F1F|nr:YbdD/YjiX family protein [Paenibacillus sp. J31TS4]GIP37195.1 hypothetical protein J31TS4_04750 [Paenibacillus sp. J31TS4]